MKFLSAALLLLLTFEATLKAQIVKPTPVEKVQGINPKAEIVSSSEKIVKGAPFSADAVSESVQILFDGNRITQSLKTRLYRDGEGRFRRDELPKPVGIGSFVEMPQMIFILDPVASSKFYLYPESKTARRFELKNEKSFRLKNEKLEWDTTKAEEELDKAEEEIEKAEEEIDKVEEEYEKAKQDLEKRQKQSGYKETGKDWLELGRLKQQIESRKARVEAMKQRFHDQRRLIDSRKEETEKPQPTGKKQITSETRSESSSSSSSVTENEKPAKEATESKNAQKATISNSPKTAANPNLPSNPALPVLPKGEVKTESLGTRDIEGVAAEGVRQTTTVAAGVIGNERPIEIVYERWYSKELELIVFSKYADPRFGEQTYRLTNIKRGEPDGTLFTLPSDYQLKPNGAKDRTEPDKRTTVPRKKSPRT